MKIILDCKTYTSLVGQFNFNNVHQFIRMAQRVALDSIRDKKVIRLGIVALRLQSWIGDEIVKKFMNDPRFSVEVIIVWQYGTDYKNTALLLQKYFADGGGAGIPYVFADGTVHPSDYDILFYTMPYAEVFKNFSANDITLNNLVCYTSYGFWVSDSYDFAYNQFIHNICWKNYALTKADIILADRYCQGGSDSMVYSGYMKMDELLKMSSVSSPSYWKTDGLPSNVKKIIYAPHHSLGKPQCRSTFHMNYKFMLDYARTHQDTTTWIFKPHPLLRAIAVNEGLFSSMKEYEEYCAAWDSLPNGRYVDGKYLRIFAESDAMIFDSESFIIEYLYVNKPSLYLTRSEGLKLNEFGEIIMDAHYQASGDDFQAIEHFIEYQIDHDKKSYFRKQVFDQVLDYYHYNGMSATDFVYKDICESIWPT